MRDDRFEWDLDKAASNLRDHKVSFDDACTVFDDPRAMEDLLIDDSDAEERSRMLGLGRNHLLVVVFTGRIGDDGLVRTRIISAWKANKHEQAKYNAS